MTTVADRLRERFPQTFEEVVSAEVGFTFLDEFEDGIRFAILRGPTAICAYLGISPSHPLAGWDYDDLPISAHGGLTYAGTKVHGDGETYWYGWDYSHSGDRSTYDYITEARRAMGENETAWTPAMVYEDSWEARWEFKRLVGLAEKIARRAWRPEATEA